ncbi:MAG: hypothetical protein IT184_08980 [Acidobacteria bacterium]|nr:hypothetical protein [Acidobacteriota bacterium]
MEYPILIFLHVAAGILWAGGAVSTGLFIVPALIEAGPAAGAVMAGVARRKYPALMTALGIVAVLTGARLYMLRFSTAWLASPAGIVITLGAILGLGGLAIGMFVQKPLAQRLGRMAAQAAASDQPPSPAQIAEMQAMRARFQRVARLTAFHLLGAAVLMAAYRLAAAI